MAKFHGVLGYKKTEETEPGIFTPVITRVACHGDLIRDTKKWDTGETQNDNLSISNRFSIVSNDSMLQNLEYIRYLEWEGVKWKVNNIEIRRPRLILSISGVYNE